MTREEESRAIRAVLDGNSDAFDDLVAACEKRVYHIALKMTGNPEDAFDISQETFLKAYRSLRSFRNESSFAAWISRMAANQCIDFLRKRKRRGKLLSLDAPDDSGRPMELPDLRFAPQETLERREQVQAVRSALGQLPEEQRLVLVLRDVEGLSYQEIADTLKMELGTVKSRIYRARANLAALLTESGNFSGKASSREGKGR